MATAASFEPYYPHTVMQLTLKEGASETFVKGNLLLIDADGYINECATDPTLIYGVAAEDAHNSTSDGDNEVGVYVITPDSVWSAKSDTTTAQTDIGLNVSAKLASSVWYVDAGSTGNKAVNVIGFDPRDALGTSGGRYIVMFAFDSIQATATV